MYISEEIMWVIFRTNVWKDNDNLAAIKEFNAHPQYNAARIDYDYAFIEMVSLSNICHQFRQQHLSTQHRH